MKFIFLILFEYKCVQYWENNVLHNILSTIDSNFLENKMLATLHKHLFLNHNPHNDT